jgi:hypothetical protein
LGKEKLKFSAMRQLGMKTIAFPEPKNRKSFALTRIVFAR